MIVIMAIATMLTTSSFSAFAQVDEVDVDFEWDDKRCQRSVVVTDEGTFRQLNCSWLQEITGESSLTTKDPTKPMPEKEFESICTIIDGVSVCEDIEIIPEPKESTKPVIKSEQQIKVEGIMKAKEIVELYGKGKLDVDDFCFGGDRQENTIFERYETIDIKTPYDNIPLGTNIQFKYEHLMSEICKAEYTLEYKIHNALRTFPGEGGTYDPNIRTSFEGIDLWKDATGLDDPTYAYAEAKMTEFNREKSEQTAAGFQCSKPGKQQGHCVKSISDQPIPDPTISKEGKEALAKYWILRETGEAEIPKQEPGVEITQESLTIQYLKGLGWSNAQIDAMLAAVEDDKTDEEIEENE